MHTVYMRMEAISSDVQVTRTFNALNADAIDAEELSKLDTLSFHDISCKEYVPVRLCFDSEAAINTLFKSVNLDIPDQIMYFDRFSNMLMEVTNSLLKELHLFTSDEIE